MVVAIILQFNSFRRTFLTFMSIPPDPDRHPVRPSRGGTAALVLRHPRHHQSFRHHHQQSHRAHRPDQYRARDTPAARSARGIVAKALASDPADLGNDGAWTCTYGDCRRRVVAADGGFSSRLMDGADQQNCISKSKAPTKFANIFRNYFKPSLAANSVDADVENCVITIKTTFVSPVGLPPHPLGLGRKVPFLVVQLQAWRLLIILTIVEIRNRGFQGAIWTAHHTKAE